MAAFVLTDAVVWIGPYAMQGLTNSVALSLMADAPETTPFGSTHRTRAPGLKGVGMQIEGNWDAAVDLGFQGALLGASHPVTIAQLSALGTPAFLFKAIAADYKIGGAIGDVAKFSAGAQGADRCVRGSLMEYATRSVTANGTGRQLGALSATQKLFASLHVPVVSGVPTLDVTIESDDNTGFSSPTTRATLTQITAAAAVWTEIAGPITDDWWRFKFTIGGTTPSFSIAGAMGIG
jgi:hypothetical protein